MNNKPYHHVYREHVLSLAELVDELASMPGQPVEFQPILRRASQRVAKLHRQATLMQLAQEYEERVEQERLF